MGLFDWWKKKDKEQQELQEKVEHAKRKCKLIVSAYQKCMAANKDRPEGCKRLDNAVVICYGNEIIKHAMEDLTECIHRHKSKDDCDVEIDAVREALRKLGAYPVKD